MHPRMVEQIDSPSVLTTEMFADPAADRPARLAHDDVRSRGHADAAARR